MSNDLKNICQNYRKKIIIIIIKTITITIIITIIIIIIIIIVIIIIIYKNNYLLKYSTQIAIYKLKVYKKELLKTYSHFISIKKR